ncbi:hypothetical protein D9756_005653 [Leucocoprinus leucothites]|uniref:Kri1-like C-terminal domain-containing protein n=1 Tax=Leucocoprinus leucothites TaxID=201217 RepID=A0A8H5D7J7_9AGAR|nr:hypothetical protein D9756_005653 [Leucoagaricus leucothites]
MLSDSEGEKENDEVVKLTINEHYAKAFQYRKEREELDKLKAKLGSDVSESDLEEEETDSESAESEDEDGEELTPAVDAAILRTLARIRRKDPSIYESGKGVYDEEQKQLAANASFTVPGKNKKKESAKPMTLRQAALEAQLAPSRSPSPEPLTHVQEQTALRNDTISAFHTAATHSEDDEDDLLVPREKTKDEQEREEEEYRTFLEREVGDLKEIIGVENDAPNFDDEDDKKSKKKKKKKSNELGGRKSKEEEDQEFLMNYILNRGWIDKSKDRVPTYKEITKKSKKPKSSNPEFDARASSSNESVDEDEASHSDSSFESLNDAFETSYNFRFEEPGSSTIPSFPRSIPSLVRREDTTRKDARERKKKRKEEEMEKKREEVRRLKALKMREIRRKLETIGREGGLIGAGSGGKGKGKSVRWQDDDNEDDGEMDDALKELDLDGDWDPIKHDQQMAGLYGGTGHGEGDWEDAGEVDDNGKPIWKDDIDIGDIHLDDDEEDIVPVSSKQDKKKKKKKKKSEDGGNEDAGVDIDAMDADVIALKKELGEEEEWDGTDEMRKRKLDEYMEEIYNLDFNDMVGDLPTRFKYVPVASQSYSLTPTEILLATDKELNEFMSVKRYAPYKNDARKWDAKRQQKLKELKQALTERSKNGGWLVSNSQHNGVGPGTSTSGQSGEGVQMQKKRKGKKERMRARAAAEAKGNEGAGVNADAGGGDGEIQIDDTETKSAGAKAGSRKKNRRQSIDLDGGKESEKLEGTGRKRKLDVTEAEEQERQQLQSQHIDMGEEDENSKPKKKRRRKHKGKGEDGVDGNVDVE